MRYLSVCSGIEAATVAWHPLGWEPVAFADIEPFPSAVLDRHYPAVPNLGDMERHRDWRLSDIDLLVGGTPCQSFSVAGLRKGMADPRGNLALVYLAIAERLRPTWLVWENVPGVLSSSGGRDFGAFLGGLVELGYGFAYRVLDAQYFGVPQRRRRVFVVGHSGGWQRPAAVLFERESLRRNPAPGEESREGTAPTLSSRPAGGGGLGTDHDLDGGLQVTGTLQGYSGRNQVDSPMVTHALSSEGADASEDGSGRGTPLVSMCLNAGGMGRQDMETETLIAAPLTSGSGRRPEGRRQEDDENLVCFAQNQREEVRTMSVAGSLPAIRRGDAKNESLLAFQSSQSGTRTADTHATLDGHNGSRRHAGVIERSNVRRLTPRECERLQGFPDDYTLIEYRGKAASDSARYRALGNSMAVPVMAWIGSRIRNVLEKDDAQA